MDNDKVGAVTERTPEQVKADEAEGEKAFADGVAKTTGADLVDDKQAKTDDAETQAAAKATAEAQAKEKADSEAKAAEEKAAAEKAAADPWKEVPAVVRDEFKKLGDIPSQISKLAGHIGGFKRQLDQITATASAAAEKKGEPAPTKLEIAEALADPEKWKQLQEDFPEWMGPVAAELTRLRKEMSAVAKSAQERPAPQAVPAQAEPVNTAAIIAEAEERAYVRYKHPDWKAICASPEFAKDWLPKQSEDIKAKAASESADDAIAVFDAYKAHRQKLADEAAGKARQEKRLAAAVPAAGSAEPPVAGISDEEAFEMGLKKTLRKAS